MNDVKDFRRQFENFSVSVRRGDKSKKKMVNSLVLTVPGDRADSTVRLTLREARSLRAFLDQALS